MDVYFCTGDLYLNDYQPIGLTVFVQANGSVNVIVNWCHTFVCLWVCNIIDTTLRKWFAHTKKGLPCRASGLISSVNVSQRQWIKCSDCTLK